MVRLVIEPVGDLTAYATVPSAFEASTVFQVTGEQGSWRLVEQPLGVPFLKDYDAVEPPLSWPREFDTSRWTVIAAQAGSARVGGALIAHDSAGVDLLEQRSDLAVIWDLRVALGSRRHGIGRMLLDSAERWSVARGCSELKVETQNTNVAACRLYARHGFRLAGVCRGAYPHFPDEVRLIWRKRLRGS